MRSPNARQARGFKLALFALVGALVLSACGNAPGGSSDSDDSGKGVTIAGVFCVCFANAYVAWKKGFFEEEGVKVDDVVSTAGGSDTFAALTGGDADFGLSGLDAIMRGKATGVDVRGVATVSPEFYALSVREQVADEITSPADLKGRKVSVSKIGSGSYAFLKLLLKAEGLSEDDVTIVQLGGIDTTMAGLKRGTVDAAITWEPGTSQGEVQEFAKVISNSLDPDDHEALYGSEASIAMTLAVTQKTIDRDPEMVQSAVRALDKANGWMAEHSAEEIADVIEPMAEGLDRELLVAAVEDTMATMPENVDVSEAAYRTSAELLKEAGILKSVPPMKETFDCEIAECVD